MAAQQSTGTHPFLGTMFVDNSANFAQSFVGIGNIEKFTPPKLKRGQSKTTYLSSIAAFHTYKPGWLDGDTVKLTLVFAAGNFATMFTYFVNDTDVRYYKIRYNDGSTATTGSTLVFLAMISEIGDNELSRDSDDPISTEITLKVSGQPIFTSAT